MTIKLKKLLNELKFIPDTPDEIKKNIKNLKKMDPLMVRDKNNKHYFIDGINNWEITGIDDKGNSFELSLKNIKLQMV